MSIIKWRNLQDSESRILQEGRDDSGNVYYTYVYKDDPGRKKRNAVVTKDFLSGTGPTPEAALEKALGKEK